MKLSSLQQFGDVRNVKAIAEKVFKARRRFHLYRATLCVGAVFAVARYLSVCPSVALVYCIDTVEDIVKVLSRPGSLSFYFSTLSTGTQFQGNPFSGGGGRIHAVCENLRFSPQITVYFGNGTR